MIQHTPKISVIVPVFNTEKYLSACLDSILSQSMADFEIIAVNDASTDDSPRILAHYAERDSRIRIVHHERNKGLLAGRLSGIRAAEGKYIMFLDSDDCFIPGVLKNVLKTAEKTGADIVNFPMELRLRSGSGRGKLVKYSRPCKYALHGRDVFQKYFEEDVCSWMLCQKLFLTELCRKTAEYIPDRFCLMGEDFCFYTICSFFAEHYEPVNKPGYIYYIDSGISSGQKTTLEKFLDRQSPVQALCNIRDFLLKQGVFEKYASAFHHQEPRVFEEHWMRWMRYLPDKDRTTAFNALFRQYDQCALFMTMRRFFSGRDEHILERMTGEDPEPVSCPEKLNNPCMNPVLQNTDISTGRWEEWKQLITADHCDAVILPPDENAERLFWDIRAIRNAGAAAVCRKEKHYLDTLNSHGVKSWLIEDRILRQASFVLTSDEESAKWYRKRNCHAGTSLDRILPPQKDAEISALMSALEKSELISAYYRIDPSADGETFVPFFRKLDHLFRKLPAGFRKNFFSFCGKAYDKICGY